MSRTFAVAFGVGLAVVAVLVAGILFMQRGSAIQIESRVLKVRTAPLDENSTIAVFDLRVSNPSNLIEEVRQVEAEMVDASGNVTNGDVISEGDTKRVFEAVPMLGQKYLDTLSMRTRLAPRSVADYMVAVRIPLPFDKVEARRKFVLHVDEVDGKNFDFNER